MPERWQKIVDSMANTLIKILYIINIIIIINIIYNITYYYY